jgi:hypothetical protein
MLEESDFSQGKRGPDTAEELREIDRYLFAGHGLRASTPQKNRPAPSPGQAECFNNQ